MDGDDGDDDSGGYGGTKSYLCWRRDRLVYGLR